MNMRKMLPESLWWRHSQLSFLSTVFAGEPGEGCCDVR